MDYVGQGQGKIVIPQQCSSPPGWSIKTIGLLRNESIRVVDESHIEYLARNWTPLQLVRVLDRQDETYKSVATLVAYRDLALRCYRKKALIAMLGYGLGMLLCALFGVFAARADFILFGASLCMLFVLCLRDFLTLQRAPSNLPSRGDFIWNLLTKTTLASGLGCFAALMLVSALSQIYLDHKRGAGYSAEVFGFIYTGIKDGEHWRAFSAQLVHGNLSHWLSNLVLGSATVVLAQYAYGAIWPLLLFAGGGLSFYGGFILNGGGSAGSIGMSAGVFFLLGCCASARLVPGPADAGVYGLRLQILFGALITVMSSAAVFERSANVDHMVGLLCGIGLGWLLRPCSRLSGSRSSNLLDPNRTT